MVSDYAYLKAAMHRHDSWLMLRLAELSQCISRLQFNVALVNCQQKLHEKVDMQIRDAKAMAEQ